MIPRSPYLPTKPEVVEAMLRLARIGPQDVVYDLGCGDGRIVIEAARRYGARGVGIDIDPDLIAQARAAAGDLPVEFRVGDVFEADVRDATVVMLYMMPALLEALRDKLLRDLRPGTRIVSHSFRMGAWEPDCKLRLPHDVLYLWTVSGSS